MRRFGIMTLGLAMITFQGVAMGNNMLYDVSAMPRVDAHCHISGGGWDANKGITAPGDKAKMQFNPADIERAVDVMKGNGITIYVSLNGHAGDLEYSRKYLQNRLLFASGDYNKQERIIWGPEDIPADKKAGYVGYKYRMGACYISKKAGLNEALAAQAKEGMPVIGMHIGESYDTPKYRYDYVPDAVSVIEKHPGVTFIMAHSFYLSHSDQLLDTLAHLFDTHPNMYMDLGYCSSRWGGFKRFDGTYVPPVTYKKLRDFLIKYKTRILFGTDYISGLNAGAASYLREYDRLESNNPHTLGYGDPPWGDPAYQGNSAAPPAPQKAGDGTMQGLNLPLDVLNYIYYWNAARLIPRVKETLASLGFPVGSEPAAFPEQEVASLRKALAIEPSQTIKAGPEVNAPVACVIANPLAEPLSVELNWEYPIRCAWKVTPVKKEIALKPGERQQVSFAVAFKDSAAKVAPSPRLRAFMKTRHGTFVTGMALPVDASTYLPYTTAEVTCPRLAGAPALTGKADIKAWKGAALLSPFKTLIKGEEPEVQTEVHVAYDANNLYLAVRAHEPDMASIVTRAKVRDDDNTWSDDCIEVMLDTKLDRATYFHYIINANGVYYDARKVAGYPKPDPKWNGEITVKPGKEKKAWTLEMAIPFKQVEMPPPAKGTKIGFEVTRSRQKKHGGEITQWCVTGGGNHVPGRFGVLEFE